MGVKRGKPEERGGRGPGRPPGSIKLTPENRRLLIAAIEAGASDHAAARAAGVDPRTFRAWRAIVEGRHPTRAPTPGLLGLFREIDEAAARARIAREIAVDAKTWLKNKARSKPGLDGWTEPVPEESGDDASPVFTPTAGEFEEILRALAEATGLSLGRCGDRSCPCSLHQEEAREET